MDSMDWFDPESTDAASQVQTLNHALKTGGRILLRSASIEPWYMQHFQENGFETRRVGARFPCACIDRYVWRNSRSLRKALLTGAGSICTRRLGSVPRPGNWRGRARIGLSRLCRLGRIWLRRGRGGVWSILRFDIWLIRLLSSAYDFYM